MHSSLQGSLALHKKTSSQRFQNVVLGIISARCVRVFFLCCVADIWLLYLYFQLFVFSSITIMTPCDLSGGTKAHFEF